MIIFFPSLLHPQIFVHRITAQPDDRMFFAYQDMKYQVKQQMPNDQSGFFKTDGLIEQQFFSLNLPESCFSRFSNHFGKS